MPGSPTFITSTSNAVVQIVNQAATTTALNAAPNPTKSGQSVTFTATVTSGFATPVGTVTFKDSTTTIGTVTLSNGVATFETATLGRRRPQHHGDL